MNILYTIFSFDIGGAEKLVFDIVNNWNNKHEDNIYLCIINDQYNEELLSELKKNSKINVICLKRRKGGEKLKYILKYIKFIKQNKIELIHCQCINSVKFSSIIKILNPKVKIFHTVHDTTIYNNFKKIDIIIDKLITNKIVAISDVVRKEILSKGINSGKIEKVYNAIDTKKFNIEKNQHNEINIVCVARIIPEKKGQDILIKAMNIVKEKYPDVKCYFAGSPANHDIEKFNTLKEMVKNLGLENNIVFLGDVMNIPKLLSNMDIFVLASRYEGFGLVIVEAMLAKIKVIATNLDGPREILQNGKYGDLFENEDYIQLAELLTKNIENNNNKKVLSSYEYAMNNFDIEIMIDKLKALYIQ